MVVVITPGLLSDLDNDVYHAQTDWLSSTMLKALLPERYKTGGSSDALAFGQVFHTVVLEPERVADYAILDAAAIAGNNPKTGKPYDAPQMTAKFKAAVAEAEADGKTVIAQADLDRATAMRNAIERHDMARRLIYEEDGRNELSAFAVDDNGVQHKARFDRLLSGVGVDLKSTSAKPGRDSLTRAVIDYGYDVSAAHYTAVADLLGLDVQAFTLVFVSKEPGPDGWHYVTVADIGASLLDRGRALRNQAIARHTNPAAEPYEGASGFITLVAPAWAQLREEVPA